MSLTLRAMLLVLLMSFCAEAQTRKIAVYSGLAEGLDAESAFAMRAELQRLLGPAGLDVVWKSAADRNSGQDFELVVVGSFKGSCSADPVALTSVTTSLADTSIIEGHVLPFFHVDCALLIEMLGFQAEPYIIGRALGRVIAHEIYHIVARTTAHHDSGVAKAVFSARDLTGPRFEFDSWSLARMRTPAAARVSEGAEESGR